MAKKIIYVFVVMIALRVIASCNNVYYVDDFDGTVSSVHIQILEDSRNCNDITLRAMLKTMNEVHVSTALRVPDIGFNSAYASRTGLRTLFFTPKIENINIFLQNSKTNLTEYLQTTTGLTIKELILSLNKGIRMSENNKCVIKNKWEGTVNAANYCYEQDFIFTKKPDCDFGKEEQIILRVELEDGSVFADTSQVFTFKN